MNIKLGTHTSYDKRTMPIDFQGQRSKVEVTRYTLLLNLVNMIQTEPFQLWPSNLVRTLLMTRGWHLYIFKVNGQRSKINPFYIANYKVISLFNSPVGRILQRWHCFGIFALQTRTIPGAQEKLMEVLHWSGIHPDEGYLILWQIVASPIYTCNICFVVIEKN